MHEAYLSMVTSWLGKSTLLQITSGAKCEAQQHMLKWSTPFTPSKSYRRLQRRLELVDTEQAC
jgi:hypothetical protein